jgi:hypothetical protein
MMENDSIKHGTDVMKRQIIQCPTPRMHSQFKYEFHTLLLA